MPCEERTAACLIVAKDEYQVQEALMELEVSTLPVIWTNDYNGQVLHYTSISRALQAVAFVTGNSDEVSIHETGIR